MGRQHEASLCRAMADELKDSWLPNMTSPVYPCFLHQEGAYCRYCGQINPGSYETQETYDLTKVTPIAHFADCDTYRTPCCNHEAHTREGGLSTSFKRLTKAEWEIEQSI
jgi:hypothetical protein